jgi:hypothetical protein
MKGTILDFLKLAGATPELAQQLAELAKRHDFEFTDEVSDEQLEAVAGGLSVVPPLLRSVVPGPVGTSGQVNVSGAGATLNGTYYADETEHTLGASGYQQELETDRSDAG